MPIAELGEESIRESYSMTALPPWESTKRPSLRIAIRAGTRGHVFVTMFLDRAAMRESMPADAPASLGNYIVRCPTAGVILLALDEPNLRFWCASYHLFIAIDKQIFCCRFVNFLGADPLRRIATNEIDRVCGHVGSLSANVTSLAPLCCANVKAYICSQNSHSNSTTTPPRRSDGFDGTGGSLALLKAYPPRGVSTTVSDT